MNLIAKVNNLPDYAEKYKHIVARAVDGEMWFYGAYNDESKAVNVARSVGGCVLKVERADTLHADVCEW